jgi:ABC-type glycerol-3-phosphate transport system permease component
LGCVIFAFPFYWLLTTSMKERTEIFVSPPKWVPGIPETVVSSPYASDATYPEPAMPDEMPLPFSEREMDRVLDRLHDRAAELQPERMALLDELEGGRRLASYGLFTEAAAGLPEDQWEGSTDQVTDSLAARITEELVGKVIGNVLRGFRIRGVTVLDQTQRVYQSPGEQSIETLQAASTRQWPSGTDETATLMGYDFGGADEATWSISMPMPELQDDFAGIRLPMTGDKSWHVLHMAIETPEGRYESAEEYPLADDLTVEWTWMLPEADAGFRKEKDYTDLVRAGGGGSPDGNLHITMTLAQQSLFAATMDKFTRAYSEALRYIDFWRYLGNTVLIVALSIIGALLSCSLVAYGFARLEFPGRDVLFAVLLATMMLPAQVTMVPQFLIFKYLGWYNTLVPLWLPPFLGTAFFIFMLRQFMKSIPKDLEDAAKIDGCGYLGIYWRIMLPLIKPALAAVAIFTFMQSWNNFMGPLIFLNDERLYPLSLGIYQFRMEHDTEYSMMMAASTLMMVPVLTVFFFAQRYFIQGVTLTGVKG